MEPRRATAKDLHAVVETLVLAFYDDPLWCWAFPDTRLRVDQLRWAWTAYCAPAVRQGGVWTTPGYEAVAAWIPPGGEEMSEAEWLEFEQLLEPQVKQLLGRFEEAHPHGEPHWYLSLLGTHPDHRGRGLGMALLRHNLDLIDELHAPAYLESSNPANDHRYESVGFTRHGVFTTPDNAHSVTTMWREPVAA